MSEGLSSTFGKTVSADPRDSNQTEVVQTYVTYLRNASSIFLSLGARVIIASPTPTNPYESGDAFNWTPTIYAWYSWC